MTRAEPLSFVGLRSVRSRAEKLRCVVLHWSGGAGSPEGVFRVLRSRTGPRTPDGLSCHYIVGADGSVLHTAPDELVCLHAGVANEFTIGIEACSPGYAKGNAFDAEVRRGVLRHVYSDRIRGRALTMVDFTVAQSGALVLLIEQLCAMHDIPRRVPNEPDGELMRRQMTPTELANFSGVLGHFHAHPTKNDPGTRFLARLRQRWAGQVATSVAR